MTSTVRGIPTEVSLGPAEGVKEDSVANLDNARLVDVERLVALAGLVETSRWPELCVAIRKVMNC